MLKLVNWENIMSEIFSLKNYDESVHQNLVLGPNLTLLNSPKHLIQVRNSFVDKTFYKGIIKNPKKI